MEKLNKEEIEIAQIQREIKKLDYQWIEHVFNDNYPDEVFINLTKDKDPSMVKSHKNTIGWGRFNRIVAWRKAYSYINTLK